ncbi:hypothetical protein DACRYDRAFT_112052 [Dacryopinax primogenitus]|uniref:Uncharacterized protein n=1 Tax=Dacryopinax primogenitus (strain DJM 731) TaxID=1858805 RepID=M5FNA2_DACPD|nr:uncharacterized protein DACRYDRAFT_112052 [Dacryopinax primogenitus]EJT97090.1 hypothetical protein DACRYDRAFT_112052 [Dacryopinax primogenitus]
MNRQVASGGDLAALRVAHDLIYQFMDVYLHYRRTGQLPQLSVPLAIPTREQMLAYLAAVRQGVSTPDPSSTSSMDTSSTSTFGPAVELPYISHPPGPISSPDPSARRNPVQQYEDDLQRLLDTASSDESMSLIQHLLEDVSVPDTLRYSTTTRHSTPPLAFVSAPSTETSLPHPEMSDPPQQVATPRDLLIRHDRSSDFPQTPSTISWHPSRLSNQSSDEAFLEQYVGPRLPVTMPLPAINESLPLAFLVYFYELGSHDATLSTLDVSLVPE